MTRIFNDDGQVVPVTKVTAGPCVVTQIKTQEKDGYQAVQVAYGTKRKITKALQGHFKNQGKFQYVREFPVQTSEGIEIGDQISVKNFVVGEKVKVVGTNKGKGFQGVVKRHGFHGSPASHGHKDQLRMPGSIGATDAARVFKGMRMGGQMGNKKSTVDNLEVIKVDEADNFIYLKGAIPGARGTFLIIKALGDMELVKKSNSKSAEKTEVKNEVDNKSVEEITKESTEVKTGDNK